MKISRRQIQKIYATARELGVDDDMLHTYVFNRTGSEHISTLTMKEAIHVIDGLEAHRVQKDEQISGKSTGPQQKFILDLEKKLGWQDDPKRLKGFITKYAGVENVKWLTQRQASNIIEGLKKVLAREKRRGSHEEWKAPNTDPAGKNPRHEAQS